MQAYKVIDINEYSQSFKDIIEFGDVQEDELKLVLPFMGLSAHTLSNDFQAKSSNGMSFVCVTPEIDDVYQKFKSNNISKNINNILSTCDPVISYPVWINKKTSITKEYDLFDFLPRIRNYIDTENIIVWEKIIPLNSFTPVEIKDILEKNIIKFLWDIGRAINGLHHNGIYHGDSRVDNIGIKDGNFVLFDFDSSKKIDHESSSGYVNMMKDYNDLIVSIKFNLSEDGKPTRFNNIAKLIPNVSSYMFSFTQNTKLFEYIKNIDDSINNTHDMIETIENMSIVY